VIPAKTLSVPLPVVEEDLLPHLLRGFWDADGCVTTKKGYGGKRDLVLSANCCSPALMQGVHRTVCTVTGSKSKLYSTPPKGNRKPKYLSSVSCLNAARLGDWMWNPSSSETRGDRKFRLFLSLRRKEVDFGTFGCV
jgi:hypothetical protein